MHVWSNHDRLTLWDESCSLLYMRDEVLSFFAQARIMQTCSDDHFRLLHLQNTHECPAPAEFKNTAMHKNERE